MLVSGGSMIVSFRYFAQRTLRIERMYAFWGQDIDKKTTPFDLNREFRVSFDVRGARDTRGTDRGFLPL